MNFTELMEVKSQHAMPFGGGTRMYHGLQVGNFTMSVQASEYHYCSPRETVDLDEYDSFEIALFDEKGWINPHTDERFKDFPKLEDLLDRYENADVAVGGYIPKETVQELYEYLSELSL